MAGLVVGEADPKAVGVYGGGANLIRGGQVL
jgi:hypothetical protein